MRVLRMQVTGLSLTPVCFALIWHRTWLMLVQSYLSQSEPPESRWSSPPMGIRNSKKVTVRCRSHRWEIGCLIEEEVDWMGSNEIWAGIEIVIEIAIEAEIGIGAGISLPIGIRLITGLALSSSSGWQRTAFPLEQGAKSRGLARLKSSVKPFKDKHEHGRVHPPRTSESRDRLRHCANALGCNSVELEDGGREAQYHARVFLTGDSGIGYLARTSRRSRRCARSGKAGGRAGAAGGGAARNLHVRRGLLHARRARRLAPRRRTAPPSRSTPSPLRDSSATVAQATALLDMLKLVAS
ncbi:hypothetical protein EVAR_11478_1 [Eumeta japonica]|uniref:Uncharacterized protein n=1 Tax=Eumeta variegata TaxID=151549 RepID=A0A4C1TYQ9_EUMVA|nr:hypothetical protein EVAR_11478_1 [Eumeta japonica]